MARGVDLLAALKSACVISADRTLEATYLLKTPTTSLLVTSA
jgi:hypothetical protein